MNKKAVNKFLRRKITLLVIPHHSAQPVRFTAPLVVVMLCGFVAAVFFLGAFSLFARQTSYHLVRRNNRKLEQENLYFSRELSRLKEAAEELSAMQTEIRNLNRNIPKTSQSSAHRGEGGFTFAPPAGEVFSRQEFQAGLDSLEDLLADLKREFSAIQATPLIWPVDGNITSSFGNRTNPFTRRWEFHSGIDIANAVGTPILAPAAGKVVLVERTRLAGNLLVIEHGNGTTTKYAHCHRVLVRRGDRIERGEKIALMGNTGLSTGPHLHYEVHLNGRPVNPYRFMSLKFAAAGPAAD